MRKSYLFAALACGLALTTACTTDNAKATRALEDLGFTNIRVDDSGVFLPEYRGCSKGDGEWYYVEGTNPAGKNVNMVVCCGNDLQFKGCTTRSR